ncbi:DUF72 domain-containing protein [Actinopolymorpha pittospori]|uniref:Uncharacterized protein YecE (DUF72 family) n=1 Tax=Actinopolymorpha pittospori TaxID=648752 RepID=A0A927MVU4_9ACTN|nr:uncharacterized protein YecE (DUF72 family) [Actinopolymorpha pittospori]
MANLLVGTASWTDKTLLESGWYPSDADTPEKRLRHYAEQFPLVEVDSTYYTPPNARNSELWAARTPKGFTFNVKAFSLLTQHPARTSALYKDLRPRTEKKNLYLKDLDATSVDAVWERFLGALGPLYDAGKLGSLLFQFPPWFGINRRNKHYILEVKERSAPYQVSVEFRHASWMSEDNREETLDFLRSYAVPFVCVDMPQGYRSSIPPVLAVTGDLAVVRFHGHSDRWESRNIYERFGYLYSEEELLAWVPHLRGLADEAPTTHVLMNNCYRDYAQTNAEQLTRLLHD